MLGPTQKKTGMSSVATQHGFFPGHLPAARLNRDWKSRFRERGGAWLLIAAAHVALLFAFTQTKRIVTPPEASPIQAELITESTETSPPPPAIAPALVRLHVPAIEPPLVSLPQEAPQPVNAITVTVAESPQVAPPAPRVITDVAYLEPPAPKYPPESRRRGEEGMVVLRVLIDEAGRADRVEIEQSSGHYRLDEAARVAVERALFRPYVENGIARAVLATIPIEFTWKPRRSHRTAQQTG